MHPVHKILSYIVDDMREWQLITLLVCIGFCVLVLLMWPGLGFIGASVGAAFLIIFTAIIGGVGVLLERVWHRLKTRKQ